MNFSFCSIASGSSGNAYLIKTDETALIVDAGISVKRILAGLASTGTDIKDVSAVLVTHEHSDHIKSLAALIRRLPHASVFANQATWAAARADIDEARHTSFCTGDTIDIGDIKIVTFAVSHDAADPVGYSFRHDGGEISIVTDTGVFTEEIMSVTADADILILESNHDFDMLTNGRYPAYLKRRILSKQGHLSNLQAAEAIIDIMGMDKKQRCILLAHLSKENNNPQLAKKTVQEALAEMDYYSGRDLYIKTLSRERMSALYRI